MYFPYTLPLSITYPIMDTITLATVTKNAIMILCPFLAAAAPTNGLGFAEPLTPVVGVPYTFGTVPLNPYGTGSPCAGVLDGKSDTDAVVVTKLKVSVVVMGRMDTLPVASPPSSPAAGW